MSAIAKDDYFDKSQGDILTAGELAINRFRELDKIMSDAEKFRQEYERLKKWLSEGKEILGV